MKTVMFNIFMAITLWFVPQFVIGFLFGLFGAIYDPLTSYYVPASVIGLLASIISEVCYWTHVAKRGRA